MPRINKTQLAKLHDRFKPPEIVRISVVDMDSMKEIETIGDGKRKPTIKLVIRI